MSGRVLVFPGEDALIAALSSDLLPAPVQARKVDFWTDADGAIFVRPVRKLKKDVIERLLGAGVRLVDSSPPASAIRARVWPRIIPPRRLADPDVTMTGQTVLLRIDGGAARTLINVAAELLRLGCDRCAYQFFAAPSGQPADAASAGVSAGAGGDVEPQAYLRVFDPPYYTVAAASEPDAAYRAFVPVRSGDARTWIELGFWHPLASAFVPPAGHIGVIAGDGEWREVPDGPWRDIFEIVDITLPPDSAALTPIVPPRRLEISLRLTSATRTEAPSLWVIRGDRSSGPDGLSGGFSEMSARGRSDAIDHVDSLVGALPDDVIGRLLFAVVGDPTNPVIVLRARHGRTGPPSLDVPGVAMVPLFGLSNLYIPHDAMLEPPLRRDTVRDLLTGDDDSVFWLQPASERQFRVESAPERAFSPLADWIDYLVHSNAEALESWVRAVTLEFDAFQSIGTEWAAGPPKQNASKGADKPRQRNLLAADNETPSTVPYAALEAANEMLDVQTQLDDQPTKVSSAPSVARPVSAVEAELADLERAFLDSETGADADERNRMWLAMSGLLSTLGRHRDAALCYVRAVWERPVEPVGSAGSASPVISEWIRAEREALGVGAHELLWRPVTSAGADSGEDASPASESSADVSPTGASPAGMSPAGMLPAGVSTDEVRAIAAHWIATALADLPLEPIPDDGTGSPMRRGRALQQVQSYFDSCDHLLDVRTLWLLRWSLARHAGSDTLGLARARDRILQSLHGGLSLERDVPTFLRFLDRQGGGDSVAAARLGEGLESLVELLERTPRQRSSIEAPTKLTGAYVWLGIAYGFARLGQSERAGSLRQEAAELLDMEDPVHDYLYRVYSARIDQALQGLPPETPLSAELARNLNDLVESQNSGQLTRYRVDRLREASEILEPQVRVDAITGFLSRRQQQSGEILAGLYDLTGDALAAEVQRWLGVASAEETPLKRRADLYDELMDFFPLLPSVVAVPGLHTIVAGVREVASQRRAELLEEALMLVGHFGREKLAGEIAQDIAELLREASTSEAEAMAPTLGGCLRDLSRVGMHDRVAQLSDALAGKLGGESVRELDARIRSLATDDRRKQSASTSEALSSAVQALEARLHVAGGLAYLGHLEQAMPILEAARGVLDKTTFRVVDHTLRLTRALTQALGQCPQEHALSALEKLASVLAKVTDSYNTNTHFCRSVIVFMESLVLGYAKSDLALGEFGRRFLDEDEYLVRRRIHREIGETP